MELKPENHLVSFGLKMLDPKTFDSYFSLSLSLVSVNIMMNSVQINLILAVTIDRYIAVCHPIFYFQTRNSSRKKWIVFACFVFGIIPGSIAILEHHDTDFSSCSLKNVVTINYLYYCTFCTVLPSIAITMTYAFINKAISKRVSLTNCKIYKYLIFNFFQL